MLVTRDANGWWDFRNRREELCVRVERFRKDARVRRPWPHARVFFRRFFVDEHVESTLCLFLPIDIATATVYFLLRHLLLYYFVSSLATIKVFFLDIHGHFNLLYPFCFFFYGVSQYYFYSAFVFFYLNFEFHALRRCPVAQTASFIAFTVKSALANHLLNLLVDGFLRFSLDLNNTTSIALPRRVVVSRSGRGHKRRVLGSLCERVKNPLFVIRTRFDAKQDVKTRAKGTKWRLRGDI